MPGGARVDVTRILYHVMERGHGKHRIADGGNDRRRFVSRLGNTASSMEMTIYAWSLMSDSYLCRAQHKTCYVKPKMMHGVTTSAVAKYLMGARRALSCSSQTLPTPQAAHRSMEKGSLM
jgi:hypothetical protein